MGFTLLPFVKESLWFDSYMCVVVKLFINLCARRVDMCGERRAKA